MKVALFTRFWNPFWSIPPVRVDQLRGEFPDVEFVHAQEPSQLPAALAGAEVFFGYRLEPEDFEAADKLRWIHAPAANVFQFSEKSLPSRQFILTNSRGEHAGPIAEHVIGSMLVFSRRFLECWRFQSQSQYGAIHLLNTAPPLSELRGKTLLILGLGGIGRELARLAKAFGMRVLAVKRHTDGAFPNVDQLYAAADFRKALPEADYFAICLALTAETDGMIGETELALLKPGCVLINIARAAVVDQEALLQCLKNQRIRGAALDVFEKEPLPADSELYRLPNVFLTPHVAGVSTAEHWERMFALFKDNLRRYRTGQPLRNVVDRKAGY